MKYAKVKYKGTSPLYTFKTNFNNLKQGESLLVEDKLGFSIVSFVQYTNETTTFECRYILMREKEMKNLAEKYK